MTLAYGSVMAGGNSTIEEDGPAMAGDTGKMRSIHMCQLLQVVQGRTVS